MTFDATRMINWIETLHTHGDCGRRVQHCHCDTKIAGIKADEHRTCSVCWRSFWHGVEVDTGGTIQLGSYDAAERLAEAYGTQPDMIQKIITADGRIYWQPMILDRGGWRPLRPGDLDLTVLPATLASSVSLVVADRFMSDHGSASALEVLDHLFATMTVDDIEESGRPALDFAYCEVLSADPAYVRKIAESL